MNTRTRLLTLSMISVAALLAACASTPPPATPTASASTTEAAEAPATAPDAAATEKSPPGQTKHKWSVATEAEVAAELDKKFQEAAKQFVKLKKDDQIMYCKRYRVIGSMIPTIHCITEAELRKQVEDSDEARDRMRRSMGKCDISNGCSAGG